MPLRDVRSQEVLEKLSGFRGAQNFMRLYFKLPNFFRYVDKYPAAMDTLYQLRRQLEIEGTPGMLMDELVLSIAREWMSPLLDDVTRDTMSDHLGATADHLLILASKKECRHMM